ncbi:hypothetical protein Hanom_Chr03g00255401 [Helianthus anomalus]
MSSHYKRGSKQQYSKRYGEFFVQICFLLTFLLCTPVLGAKVEKSSNMVITDAKNLRTTALAPNYFEPRRPCLRRVPDCLTFCPQFTIPLCLDRYCRCNYP